MVVGPYQWRQNDRSSSHLQAFRLLIDNLQWIVYGLLHNVFILFFWFFNLTSPQWKGHKILLCIISCVAIELLLWSWWTQSFWQVMRYSVFEWVYLIMRNDSRRVWARLCRLVEIAISGGFWCDGQERTQDKLDRWGQDEPDKHFPYFSAYSPNIVGHPPHC